MWETRGAYDGVRNAVVAAVDAFKLFHDEEKKRLEAVVLDGEGGVDDSKRHLIDGVIKKETHSEYKAVLQDVRCALTELKVVIRGIDKSISDADRPSKVHQQKGCTAVGPIIGHFGCRDRDG